MHLKYISCEKQSMINTLEYRSVYATSKFKLNILDLMKSHSVHATQFMHLSIIRAN